MKFISEVESNKGHSPHSPMDARNSVNRGLLWRACKVSCSPVVLISKSNRRSDDGRHFFRGISCSPGLKETDVSRFPPFFVRSRLMVSFFLEMIAMRGERFSNSGGAVVIFGPYGALEAALEQGQHSQLRGLSLTTCLHTLETPDPE